MVYYISILTDMKCYFIINKIGPLLTWKGDFNVTLKLRNVIFEIALNL